MSQIFLELGRADPVQVDCGPSIEHAHGYRHSPYQHAHGPRDRETLGLKIPSPLASTKPRAIQEVGGKLVTDASGRIQTAFYDQGLATELEAFKTFVHELDHIEAFEAAGALSSEQAAEARTIAAASDIQISVETGRCYPSGEDQEDPSARR